MAFFFTDSYNRFDVIWLIVAGVMLERSGLLYALGIVIVGSFVSVLVQLVYEQRAA